MARTTNVVNLDALIKRADMGILGEEGEDIKSMPITGLEPRGWLYPALRKPDFQRETASWSPEQVADLIATFLRRELIPAVILWRSGKDVFVIDGAHRLSALIAWVHDDYGHGSVSQDFFQNRIPEEQVRAALRTREIVNATVGSYREHKDAQERPDRAKPEILERASRLGWHNIEVQWIRSADHDKAEKSFFRINQGGTRLDNTEQRILLSRASATALASRAILRGGSGHSYWNKFSGDTQRKIEDLGREIHGLMFIPPIDLPIRTLDLPLAGQGYGPHALPFVFDLVNIANRVQVGDSSKKNGGNDTELLVDADGNRTVEYLIEVRRLIWRALSNNPSSLGLHPALYFYSKSGTFQRDALLAFIALMKDWGTPDYIEFTRIRASFEAFLLANRGITEAVRQLGAGARSRPRIVSFWKTVISLLSSGKTAEEVSSSLRNNTDYKFLIQDSEDRSPLLALEGGSFTRETKGATYLAEALSTAPKCPTCGGIKHKNGMQVGHERHRRDGGSNDPANALMQHPFCNSTYAN